MGILPEMEYCMEIINPAAMPAHRAEWISSTMTSVALRRACRRLLPARERPSQAFPSQRESRQWLTGTKEFPSDQPRVSIRNPQRYFMEQWSKTLAGSSTFFERERSNRLSSTMKTSLRVRQGFHESVDDAGRKQCCETLPVRPGVVKEAVNGVFGESLPKCACFHLHIETPVGKHHTEQEAEDIHYRDPFLLSGITFKEQFSKVEPLHKFCGKIRNAVSIIGCLWYT